MQSLPERDHCAVRACELGMQPGVLRLACHVHVARLCPRDCRLLLLCFCLCQRAWQAWVALLTVGSPVWSTQPCGGCHARGCALLSLREPLQGPCIISFFWLLCASWLPGSHLAETWPGAPVDRECMLWELIKCKREFALLSLYERV